MYLFNSDLNADVYDEVQPKYFWHRGDYYQLSDALSRVDWKMEFIYLSVDSAYEVFLTILNNLVGLYVPMCVSNHRLPWAVKPPVALKLATANAWNRYKVLTTFYGRHSEITTEVCADFGDLNYQFRHFFNYSRAEYEQSLINRFAISPKLFHSYAHKKKKGRIAVGHLRLPSGQAVDASHDMAELFADTFASAFVGDVPC